MTDFPKDGALSSSKSAMFSSLFGKNPNAKEYAQLCFSFAVVQAPYDEQIPANIHLHSQTDRMRIRWNAAHSAQALAIYLAALHGGRKFKPEHLDEIIRTFLDLSNRYFTKNCRALDLSRQVGELDAAISLLESRGRTITRDEFIEREQPAGAWYNLYFPLKQQAMRDAIDRFARKKAAGGYAEFPGFSGFSDEWAVFMMTSVWGGFQRDNLVEQQEFISFGNLAPFIVGPIEGLAKKDFGPAART